MTPYDSCSTVPPNMCVNNTNKIRTQRKHGPSVEHVSCTCLGRRQSISSCVFDRYRRCSGGPRLHGQGTAILLHRSPRWQELRLGSLGLCWLCVCGHGVRPGNRSRGSSAGPSLKRSPGEFDQSETRTKHGCSSFGLGRATASKRNLWHCGRRLGPAGAMQLKMPFKSWPSHERVLGQAVHPSPQTMAGATTRCPQRLPGCLQWLPC